MEQVKWSENVLLVDAGWLDHVTFNLTVNFERMLERRIPPGDLCRWLDCIALDSGLRPGNHTIQVIFIHSKTQKGLKHFIPGNFLSDIDGKAFRDNLGEFTLYACPVEDIIDTNSFFLQSLEAILQAQEVKQIMIVGDTEQYGHSIRTALNHPTDKHIILFTMQPTSEIQITQEQLGYSLLSAMGIKSEEFK